VLAYLERAIERLREIAAQTMNGDAALVNVIRSGLEAERDKIRERLGEPGELRPFTDEADAGTVDEGPASRLAVAQNERQSFEGGLARRSGSVTSVSACGGTRT
jgi:hypothetical protein